MGLTKQQIIDKRNIRNRTGVGKALTNDEKSALADVSKQQNDPDYRGELSPFRVDVNTHGDNGNAATMNSFGLDDYQWYSEGSELKFNDDYYLNYKSVESDGGLFTGTSLSDLSSKEGALGVLNKTKSYAQQQLKGVTSSIKDTYKGFRGEGGVDNHTSDEHGHSPFMEAVLETPQIILYEFQPNSAISEITGMFKAIFNSFDQFFDKDNKSGGSLLSNIKRTFSTDGINDIIAELLPNESLESINSSHGKIVSIPNYFYTNLIGGYYSGQYTLPFFEQNAFLHGMGDKGWESRSMKQRMFGGLSDMLDKFSEVASAFDIAAKPKWTMDGAGPAGDEITFDMTLFNSTDATTIKNIQMLNALVSGNMWTQNIFLQLSPCLYDIEVVGRYRYYFCKADIKVDFVGKQRIPPTSLVKQLSKYDDKQIGNPNAYKYIPDAYKLTIKFVSLIPNNFNTYLNYLLTDTNRISVGQSRTSTGNGVISAIKNSLTKGLQDKTDVNDKTSNSGIAQH